MDPIRSKILQLEAAPAFDAGAWQRVLADLRAQDRPAALNDARRRMETARRNAVALVRSVELSADIVA